MDGFEPSKFSSNERSSRLSYITKSKCDYISLKKMSNFTEAYIPSFGYGWYNESISYDALTGVHKNLYAKTDQKATNGNQRTDNSSNPSGYRVRAGFVDPKSDKRF